MRHLPDGHAQSGLYGAALWAQVPRAVPMGLDLPQTGLSHLFAKFELICFTITVHKNHSYKIWCLSKNSNPITQSINY